MSTILRYRRSITDRPGPSDTVSATCRHGSVHGWLVDERMMLLPTVLMDVRMFAHITMKVSAFVTCITNHVGGRWPVRSVPIVPDVVDSNAIVFVPEVSVTSMALVAVVLVSTSKGVLTRRVEERTMPYTACLPAPVNFGSDRSGVGGGCCPLYRGMGGSPLNPNRGIPY